jgi:23S rRNA (cytidine1920-2'-O)/16S rRNA (cytidine1409-2'-O)-methyltransferase
LHNRRENHLKTKKRVDILLYEKGLVETRSLAQRLIMAGKVKIDGTPVNKPADMAFPDAEISIVENARFVSRGGEKLEHALQFFSLSELSGYVCADIGSSTGGFTDCLLQHGAKKVYAVDVGYGLIHWKLRNHPDVVLMERTNARNVIAFPEIINLVTIDASFISLKSLLPVVAKWFTEEKGLIIALIKPQFEAGKKDAARGKGVIRDAEIHRRILFDILTYVQTQSFSVMGLTQSPILGPKGNKEFLVLLSIGTIGNPLDVASVINELVPPGFHASQEN